MPKPTRTLPAPLARAAQRFEKWRRTRTKRGIPDSLWDLATKLGGKYGVNQTAKTLRLDYYDLKRRVAAAAGADVSGAVTAPTFLEVVPTPSSAASECVVELEEPRGAKMRLHFKRVGASEISALSRLFWGREE